MHCLASIKLNSETDKEWKKDGIVKHTMLRNDFSLIKDIYVCKKVKNVLALLRHDDVEVLMSGLPIKLEGLL
jgi:hypothetical protein